MPKFIDDLIKGARDRYTDTDGLDYSKIATDLAGAAATYAIINPNDSNTISQFMGTGSNPPVGYMGGIPNYTASRSLVPNAFSSNYTTGEGAGLETLVRRPGMAGRQYFTPTTFAPDVGEPIMGKTAEEIAAANAAALENQALFEDVFTGVGARNVAPVATPDTPTPEVTLPDVSPTGEYSQADIDTVLAGLANNDTTIDELTTTYDTPALDILENLILDQGQTPAQAAALGGITEENLVTQLLRAGKTNFAEVADYYQDRFPGITPEQIEENFQNTEFDQEVLLLSQGGDINQYYLGGSTDGMADDIPAMISNSQPAALSDGEFVIPADVVSHLGNGNSDAGAQNLYDMMDRVRTDRTGNPNQGKQIDPNQYLA